MASSAIFSSLRRRKSPTFQAFVTPVDWSEMALLATLTAVSSEIVSSFSGKSWVFQRRNSRSLVRKIEVFVVLFEYVGELGLNLPKSAVVCFQEMYILLYRSKILLDYCVQSSKLWLLLQNHSISGQFHDLNQEILTLLDVFPWDDLDLSDDVMEQIELLQKQSRKAKLLIDKQDEVLRCKFYSFLDEFEGGRIPESVELYRFFVERLGIMDVKSFMVEIEFLEEQIVNHDGDIEPMASVLNGFVAMTRYSRFLIFGFENDEMEGGFCKNKKVKRRLSSQTYDRSSITRWMEEGHCTCPKTGQILLHTQLVPNRALRNLIVQWCTTHGVPYDPPENSEYSSENFAAPSASKAAIEANRATSRLLIKELANGSQGAKNVAAREIRLLAKTGRDNRAYIAEAGAIPYLNALLSSDSSFAQENSVTAILNLSIYEKNKCQIVSEPGCLGSIVDVLRNGFTTEARENAAATLFSLSAVHDYKKRISEIDGAAEALAGLLMDGTPRGKKDAVTALFNLSTHSDNCLKMVESGAVTALVRALGVEGVAEEAAGALALIVRQPVGAEAVGNDEMAVAGLVGMMRSGRPKAKENAVVALLELCRGGGTATTQRVLKAPSLSGLLQSLLFTGTKRARRKAASLARVFQRCENASLHFGGVGLDYAFPGNSTASRDSGFAGDVSIPMPISVPVL
ncbi:U-box domain-containing protein 17 isoform X2 [Apium graveolens]|uniref:U-box domain-containing protein 17 isoform X2 n=1 Tax=Apium graveolens TaxID=4045 RepID=UPI003D7A4644